MLSQLRRKQKLEKRQVCNQPWRLKVAATQTKSAYPVETRTLISHDTARLLKSDGVMFECTT
jgi:hypothetical protein